MTKLAQVKKDLQSSTDALKVELKEHQIALIKQDETKRVGMLNSIIERANKIRDDIYLLFNDLESEFGQQTKREYPPIPSKGITVIQKGGNPIRINIFGEEVEIRRWNQVPEAAANWILDQRKALEEYPNFIHRDKADFQIQNPSFKQLKNGLIMEVGDDKPRLLYKTKRMLKLAGFSDEIELKEA
jgi:hypothetical protein